MVEYTIYNKISGKIFSTGTAQTEQDVQNMVASGQQVIFTLASRQQYVENGQLVNMPTKPEGFYKFDYTTKEWVSDELAVGRNVKNRRNQLLQESDWTQLQDVPLANKAEWATYRQELRDIPEQSGYPTNVIWPVAPTS